MNLDHTKVVFSLLFVGLDERRIKLILQYLLDLLSGWNALLVYEAPLTGLVDAVSAMSRFDLSSTDSLSHKIWTCISYTLQKINYLSPVYRKRIKMPDARSNTNWRKILWNEDIKCCGSKNWIFFSIYAFSNGKRCTGSEANTYGSLFIFFFAHYWSQTCQYQTSTTNFVEHLRSTRFSFVNAVKIDLRISNSLQAVLSRKNDTLASWFFWWLRITVEMPFT